MKIQIIIDPQGEIRLETKGFAGASCKDASKALEQALGLVQSDKPTSELYQNSSTPSEVRNQTGS